MGSPKCKGHSHPSLHSLTEFGSAQEQGSPGEPYCSLRIFQLHFQNGLASLSRFSQVLLKRDTTQSLPFVRPEDVWQAIYLLLFFFQLFLYKSYGEVGFTISNEEASENTIKIINHKSDLVLPLAISGFYQHTVPTLGNHYDFRHAESSYNPEEIG